jgi:hypothetical protein
MDMDKSILKRHMTVKWHMDTKMDAWTWMLTHGHGHGDKDLYMDKDTWKWAWTHGTGQDTGTLI